MAERDAAAAVSLPRDALFEILSRTPVKSVCRFRCASMEWQALISDPAFVSQLEPLLVTSYCGENPYTDSRILAIDMKGNVVREIKGLGAYPLCASSLDNLICVICSGEVTRVVDVATGKVLVTSPKPAGNLSHFVVRLGRAAVSGSCKAVRIVDFRRAYGAQPPQICEVLTLGGHGANWRRAQPPPATVRLLDFRKDWAGATVDGVVHFLSNCTSLARVSVLCFDLEREEWRTTIEGPLQGEIESWSNHHQIRIAELNKSLCMIKRGLHKNDHPSADMCNIWILTDRGNSTWVKAYSIPTNQAYAWGDFEPLRVMPDGVKLLFYYFVSTLSKPLVLRVYDSRSGTCATAMNMPNHTFERIVLCSLHLEHFVALPHSTIYVFLVRDLFLIMDKAYCSKDHSFSHHWTFCDVWAFSTSSLATY
ncbi:hypothetical protein ACQ4PT_029094 [Festuca glaucescens]